MKAQVSGSSGTKFNLKFLLEIILIIIVGAIIFMIIVLKARPDILGGTISNSSKNLYIELGGKL